MICSVLRCKIFIRTVHTMLHCYLFHLGCIVGLIQLCKSLSRKSFGQYWIIIWFIMFDIFSSWLGNIFVFVLLGQKCIKSFKRVEAFICLDVMCVLCFIACICHVCPPGCLMAPLLSPLYPVALHQAKQMNVNLMRLSGGPVQCAVFSCGDYKVNEGQITMGYIEYVYEPQ